MNTIIEKIRAEVNRMKVDYLNRSYTFVPKAMQDLLDFLSDLEKEEKPVNQEGLEEEVKAWHKKHFKARNAWEYYSGYYLTRNSELNLARHFYELGKKDMREQMLKEAVEAKVIESFNPATTIGEPTMHGCTIIYEDENKPYLIAGDKVKLIIVKED